MTAKKENVLYSRSALLLAGLAVAVRPTASVFFIPLILTEPILRLRAGHFVMWLSHAVIPAAVLSFGFMLFVDYWLYGTPILTWLPFIRFNIVNNLASFYGIHTWHWYLTQGLPTVFLTSYPLVLVGAALSFPRHKYGLAVTLANI